MRNILAPHLCQRPERNAGIAEIHQDDSQFSPTAKVAQTAAKRVFALSVAAAALAACASPYVYQKEVTSFNSSVTNVSDAIKQGLANIDQDQASADLATIVDGRTGVKLSDNCGNPSSAGPPGSCRLLPVGLKTDAPAREALPEPQLRKAMGVLKAYAEGLAAVSNAQDRKDYDAAASQLSSSVSTFAPVLATAGSAGAVAAAALPPVVTFASWTVGQSLDQARFDTLKSALNAVGKPPGTSDKSPIRIVADEVVTNGLTSIQSTRLQLIMKEINIRIDRINAALGARGPTRISADRYDAPVAALVPLVATLNSVRAVDPAAVAAGLADAHDELVKAVNDPKTQHASLLSSINDFAEKAGALAAAFGSKPGSSAASATQNK